MQLFLVLSILFVLAMLSIPFIVVGKLLTSKIHVKRKGAFYSIEIDDITMKSADNVRMLSPSQIDEFEE
jgi:hypothetical protein